MCEIKNQGLPPFATGSSVQVTWSAKVPCPPPGQFKNCLSRPVIDPWANTPPSHGLQVPLIYDLLVMVFEVGFCKSAADNR